MLLPSIHVGKVMFLYCLCVCLSVQVVTFELALESAFFWYVCTICAMSEYQRHWIKGKVTMENGLF